MQLNFAKIPECQLNQDGKVYKKLYSNFLSNCTTYSAESTKIFHINKCCPEGWSFNFDEKRCVEENVDVLNFEKLIETGVGDGLLVSVQFEGFYCQQSLVDYKFRFEDVDNFSVQY